MHTKRTLDPDALRVETFAPAEVEAPPAALGVTVANCSAVDACPTRLCTSRC